MKTWLCLVACLICAGLGVSHLEIFPMYKRTGFVIIVIRSSAKASFPLERTNASLMSPHDDQSRKNKSLSHLLLYLDRAGDTGTASVPAGLSFPEFRRCLLGEWPVRPFFFNKSDLIFQPDDVEIIDTASCIIDLLSVRAKPSVTRSIDCHSGVPFSRAMHLMLARHRDMAMKRRLQPINVSGINNDESPMSVFRVYNDNTFDGFGDHAAGFADAVLMSLLAAKPRALVIDDLQYSIPYNIPLTLGWTPCPGNNGYNWTVPDAWFTDAAFVQSPSPRSFIGGVHNNASLGPHFIVLARSRRPEEREEYHKLLLSGSTTAPLITFMANMRDTNYTIGGPHVPLDAVEWYRTDKVGYLGVEEKRITGVNSCNGLPPEFVGLLYGEERGYACALLTEISENLSMNDEGSPSQRRKLSRVSASYSKYHGYSILPRAGYGSGNTAIATQLFDWFFWPSARLIHRIMSRVGNFYRPLRQWIVAIHLRIGTPAPGSDYSDPARSDPNTVLNGVLSCGWEVMRALIEARGWRENFLWYLATDRPSLAGELRDLLLNSSNTPVIIHNGVPRVPNVSVVTLGNPSVIHTGKSRVSNATKLTEGFLDVFADHFLLSAAHAQVRSSSGFSLSAQIWGRYGPAGYAGSTKVCHDISYAKSRRLNLA